MSDTTLNLAIDISKNAILEIIKRREEELSACCEFNNFTETQYDEFNKKTDTYRECLAVLDKSEFISKDDYMRLAADFDNYKKRTIRDKDITTFQIKEKLISNMLPIIDDFDRLFSSLTSNVSSSGLHLIYNNLIKTMSSFGATRIETKCGDKFDVNLHEAIAT